MRGCDVEFAQEGVNGIDGDGLVFRWAWHDADDCFHAFKLRTGAGAHDAAEGRCECGDALFGGTKRMFFAGADVVGEDLAAMWWGAFGIGCAAVNAGEGVAHKVWW